MTEQAAGGHDDRDQDDRDPAASPADQGGESRDSRNWSAVTDGPPADARPAGPGRLTGRAETSRSAGRPGAAERPGPGPSARQSRPRPGGPASGLVNDFQRWLIKSSARNVRNQIGGQVRRSLGTGRNERGDVWDVATTEATPGAGESPECQWCPICRAARAMRESNSDVSSQISTAGNVVASAVQEAFKAVDSVLARGASGQRPPDSARWAGNPDDWEAERDSWAAEHGGLVAGHWPRADVIAVTEPGTTDADAGTAQDATNEPDGTDEPDDRS
jgi:hypothetical protein